jgi:lipoprotein signal peptidase
MDLLLPTTDAGVAAQVVIAATVFAGLVWRLWANRDARIFVIGLAMLTFGAMGVRALH